jgi:hypothetical protein
MNVPLSVLVQDLSTLQNLAAINTKDLSVIFILMCIVYYCYSKISKLEEKNEALHVDMLKVQTDCIRTIAEFKDVIIANTEAIKEATKSKNQ